MPWAITHGAEGFPDRVGRDFDILLPERFHSEAVALIKKVSGTHRWSSCLVPLRWAGAPVFLWKLEGEELHSFEMHFIDRIDWAGCILAGSNDTGGSHQRIDGLSHATWPGFAKRVLTQILAGCWQRIEERPDDFTIKAHEAPHLADQMARLFGREAGLHLIELIQRRDLPEIKHRSHSYRLQLLRRAFTPGSGVRLSPRWLSGKFARTFGIAPWRPPILVVVATEDVKSTGTCLVSEVIARLGFSKCKIISSERPPDLLARNRERWQLHIHRSLFRLIAIRCDSDRDVRSTISSRIGSGKFESGTLVISLSSPPLSEFVWDSYQRGYRTNGRTPYNRGNLPELIALKYMDFLLRFSKPQEAAANQPTARQPSPSQTLAP